MFIWAFDEMNHDTMSQVHSDEGRSFTSCLCSSRPRPMLLQHSWAYTKGLSLDLCPGRRWSSHAVPPWRPVLRQQCIGPVYQITALLGLEYIPCCGTDQIKLKILWSQWFLQCHVLFFVCLTLGLTLECYQRDDVLGRTCPCCSPHLETQSGVTWEAER